MADEITPPVDDSQDESQQDVTEPQELEDQLFEDQGLEDEQPIEIDPIAKSQNDMQAWTGRKLKDFKDEIMGGMANLLNEQQPQQPVPQQQFQQPVENGDPEPDYDLDGKSWIQWNDRQKTRNAFNAQKQADTAYFGTVETPQVRYADQAVHEAVKLEMKNMGNNQNYDPSSGQPLPPSVDAMLNYNKALRIVMEKQFSAPVENNQNPLENQQIPNAGIGVSQPGSQEKSRPTSMPTNLSSEAQKLIARSGWNAEKVRKVLGAK